MTPGTWLLVGLMAVCGFVSHVLKTIVMTRREDQTFSLSDYLVLYPYQTAATVVGLIVGIVALWQLGELSPVNAFAVGYMSDSAADFISGRARKALAP